MKSNRWLPLVLLAAPFAAAQDETPKKKPLPQELQAAMARAEVHNKRVLVIACDAEADLQKALKGDRALSRKILYEFEVVQFAGGEAAEAWQHEDGGPAFSLLSADGKKLQILDVDDFVSDDGIRAEALLAKWQPHFCPPVDAQQKLDAALAEAKASGRAIFIRFDAPW